MNFLSRGVCICSKYIYSKNLYCTTTWGLFACNSYHRKHLELISSETLSTCYFSAGWSLLWGMKDKHPDSSTTQAFVFGRIRRFRFDLHEIGVTEPAWASFSCCHFSVRFSRTINAIGRRYMPSALSNLLSFYFCVCVCSFNVLT